MRAVFDSVIFVRGLIGPYSIWGELIFTFADAYELAASPEVMHEYLEVIQRPQIVQKYRSVAGRNLQTILTIISNATIVHPTHTPHVCRDPGDDKFLAAAVASNADFIVSEDHDLLSLGEYQGTVICTAEALLGVLGRDPE